MKHNTHDTAGDYCPSCKKTLDQVTSADDNVKPPKPNDISLCFYCGTICQFDENLKLDIAPEKVVEDIKNNDPDSWLLIMKAKNFILQKNDKSRNT